jgi:hypothetical protein
MVEAALGGLGLRLAGLESGVMTTDQHYVLAPDIPAGLTIDEYRRSRPNVRRPWWRRMF